MGIRTWHGNRRGHGAEAGKEQTNARSAFSAPYSSPWRTEPTTSVCASSSSAATTRELRSDGRSVHRHGCPLVPPRLTCDRTTSHQELYRAIPARAYSRRAHRTRSFNPSEVAGEPTTTRPMPSTNRTKEGALAGPLGISRRRPGAVHRSAAPCSPTGFPRSTIGAVRLSFRVRNGTGRAPHAVAADRWAAPRPLVRAVRARPGGRTARVGHPSGHGTRRIPPGSIPRAARRERPSRWDAGKSSGY